MSPNLPNYFLADLPPEATLSAQMVGQGCETLKRNRAQYLAGRSTASLCALLEKVAQGWLEPANPLRQLALEQGPRATGFSAETLAGGLEAYFRELTAANLELLLTQDLGDSRRLDQPVGADSDPGRLALAIGPELVAHVTAGNLPIPALHSMVLGVLTRSAQFVKCASGAALLPRLFAHSLYRADAKLGACLEVAEWRGGNEALEAVLFQQADCVTATGGDEALAAIRRRLPARTRFLGYGHRVSFAFVSARILSGADARQAVAQAAADVVAWNQLGCLSPHVIYVQAGGRLMPEQFAALLARQLEEREKAEPRGELPVETAARIASRRSVYELRAAQSEETRHWCSQGSTAWTVVYENDPQFQLSPLNRFIYVKEVKSLDEALHAAESVRDVVSTVALAATPEESQALFATLARWRTTRVCPLGRMQKPPLTWRHDGRPALADLVRWVDWEQALRP